MPSEILWIVLKKLQHCGWPIVWKNSSMQMVLFTWKMGKLSCKVMQQIYWILLDRGNLLTSNRSIIEQIFLLFVRASESDPCLLPYQAFSCFPYVSYLWNNGQNGKASCWVRKVEKLVLNAFKTAYTGHLFVLHDYRNSKIYLDYLIAICK